MFDRAFRHAATLVLALATLAACDSTPLAPRLAPPARVSANLSTPSGNIISRSGATVPFSFGMYVPCANAGQGDVMQVDGTLQYAGHWISIGEQRQHNVVLTQFTGTATAWESGETYDALQREVSQSNIAYGNDGIPDSGEELQRIKVRLTNRASGAVFDVTLVGRFVQTATGEFVLSGWDGTARCE